MDIKTRKKNLIDEMKKNDTAAAEGRRIVSASVLAIFFLRTALFVFELIVYSSCELELGVLSNVLLLPLFLILYMIYDGNKGISSIPIISAIIKIAVYFTGDFSQLSDFPLGNAYTAVFLAVMVLQFAIALLVSYASKCQAYFKKIQAINFQIQKEFLSGSNRGKR